MPLIRKQIDQLENVGDSLVLSDFGGGLNDTASNEVLQNNESIALITINAIGFDFEYGAAGRR